MDSGEFCFRSFLSVISVTYPILQNSQLEQHFPEA